MIQTHTNFISQLKILKNGMKWLKNFLSGNYVDYKNTCKRQCNSAALK